MIVTPAVEHARALGGPHVARRCLARRGMLHSELEAADHVLLAPGGTLEDRGRAGCDEVWYVLSGSVTVEETGGPPRIAGRGDVLLAPAATRPRLTAHDGEAELLVLSVLARDRSAALPPRRPELPHDR